MYDWDGRQPICFLKPKERKSGFAEGFLCSFLFSPCGIVSRHTWNPMSIYFFFFSSTFQCNSPSPFFSSVLSDERFGFGLLFVLLSLIFSLL